jgi:hypothetical protein
LVLTGFLVAGLAAVAQVRKYLKKDDDEPAGGFSLSDLRALHRSGKLSAEEFEKAKVLIVEAAKLAAKREAEAREAAKKRPGAGRLPL